MPENQAIYAWRFAKADGTSRHQETPQAVGTCYTLPHWAETANAAGGDPESARAIRSNSYGFHGSVDPLDALDYCEADSFFVERVLLSGYIDAHEDDKIAASQRTTLWRADAQKTVAFLAATCAERALHKVNPAPGTFTESHAAIEGMRRYVAQLAAGELTEADLKARKRRMSEEPPPKHCFVGEPNAVELAKGGAYWAARAFDDFGAAAKALYSAAEAIVDAERTWDRTTEEGEQADSVAWVAERLWQARTFNIKLFLLMPDGYMEPGWKTQSEQQEASNG